MMRPDRLVQFKRVSRVSDGLGFAEEWADYGEPVWAIKKDVSDGERWRAHEVASHVTTRFMIRYSGFIRGISPADRLDCDGLSYDIAGVKEWSEGRRRWIEFTAAARNDTVEEVS
jgi:SPP1 family predicted phage head-tail adaptor